MAVSYMTKDGYDKILAEINYLETVKPSGNICPDCRGP